MSLVTCANASTTVDVLEGTIVRPLMGMWTADLTLDQLGDSPTGFEPGTQVTIASENGYSLVGVVDPNRTGSFLDAVHLRVIGGGSPGMSQIATPRTFAGPGLFVRDVINALCSDAGETLSSDADNGLLTTNLSAWSVLGREVGQNLRALLNLIAPSMNWRILPDGKLWIGNESWPSASGTFDTIMQNPADGSFELGIESPFVAPGTNIDAIGNVNRCVDVISSGKLRTHVFVDFPSEGQRGVNASIVRMVKQATAGVDFFALYMCQVVSQSADLTTVDVRFSPPTSSLLTGPSRVPVRFGAGIKIQLAPNATVLLGWDGGNPQAPFACLGLSSESALGVQLAGSDPVITKQDLTALISAITAMANTGNSGGALSFTAPVTYGSTIVGAGH